MKAEKDIDLNERLLALWEEGKFKIDYASSYLPPSGLAVCPRQVYYSKSKQPVTDPPDIGSRILMEYGNELHYQICRRLDKLGWYVPHGEERKFTHDLYNIVFQVDKFLHIDGQIYVGEIKTTSQYSYDGTKYIPSVCDAPPLYHYLQIQIYMYILGLPGYLIYLNRANGQMSMLRCEIDKEAADEMISRGVMVASALQEGVPPPRPDDYEVYFKGGLPKAQIQVKGEKFKSCKFCFSNYGCCKYFSKCFEDADLDPQWRKILEESG